MKKLFLILNIALLPSFAFAGSGLFVPRSPNPNLDMNLESDLIVKGRAAFGADANLGGPAGARDVFYDFESTTSDFAVSGIDNYSHVNFRHTLEPSFDLQPGFKSVSSHLFQTNYDADQTENLYYVEVLRTDANLYGSGDIETFVSSSNQVNFFGSGTLNYATSVYGYSFKGFEGTGTINYNTGGEFAGFNNSDSGGLIDINKSINILSPNYWAIYSLPLGTINTNYGLYIGDQEYEGPNTGGSWSIYSEGGKVEFSSVSGKDPTLIISDGDASNPFSGLGIPSTAQFIISPVDSSGGGARITAVSDGDSRPLEINAFYGSSDPTDNQPTVVINAGKSNGGTSVTSIGNSETAFKITNNGSALITTLGNGDTSISGTLTSTATGSLGWTKVSAANTACNTTCASACVLGQDSATKDIVQCDDATADVCFCAGSN